MHWEKFSKNKDIKCIFGNENEGDCKLYYT